MRNLPWLANNDYPERISPEPDLLVTTGLPYIIENVMGAVWKGEMWAGWLCGRMFGLPFYRHRAFETNWFWMSLGHEASRNDRVGRFTQRPSSDSDVHAA